MTDEEMALRCVTETTDCQVFKDVLKFRQWMSQRLDEKPQSMLTDNNIVSLIRNRPLTEVDIVLRTRMRVGTTSWADSETVGFWKSKLFQIL